MHLFITLLGQFIFEASISQKIIKNTYMWQHPTKSKSKQLYLCSTIWQQSYLRAPYMTNRSRPWSCGKEKLPFRGQKPWEDPDSQLGREVIGRNQRKWGWGGGRDRGRDEADKKSRSTEDRGQVATLKWLESNNFTWSPDLVLLVWPMMGSFKMYRVLWFLCWIRAQWKHHLQFSIYSWNHEINYFYCNKALLL